MRRNFHVSLVLALAFLFSLSTVAIAAPAYVYGNVTDDRLVQPIEGAALIVWDYHNPDTAWYDTTDVNGDYFIQLWSNLLDTFVVKVTATGFTPDSANYRPGTHGDSVQYDWALTGPAMGNFDSSLVVDSICQDDSSLFERVLSNVGADPLVYTVEWDSAWIVVTPSSGTLARLEKDTLQIWLRPDTSGVFEDTIVIVNNSPTPAVHIPVQLTAWPLEAYIDVDSSSIDTTLAPDSTATYERVITNTGRCVNLTFDAASDTNWLTVDPPSDTIPPNGGVDTLTITCIGPDSSGVHVGHITIDSNDPNNPTVVIDVTVTVVVGVEDEEGSKLPTSFALRRCYPNPFNTSTTIGYDLPRASRVTLEVYNLVGQKVATLVNDYEQAGYKSINWNAAEVTTGIYYYKLTAGEFVSVRKLTLLK